MRPKHPWICWLPCWLLLVSIRSFSQDIFFNHRHFSVEEGMSSRFVTNVVQDKAGFIWIGTDFGINRFDGKRFKTFNAAKNRLRADSQSRLVVDMEGKIWVNNDRRKVDILDPVSEVVTPLEKLVPELAGKSVHLMPNDNKRAIWGVVDDERVFTYDGKFTFTDKIPIKSQKASLTHFFVSPWGSFFLADKTGLMEYGINGKLLNTYPLLSSNFGSTVQTDSSILLVSFTALPNQSQFVFQLWELKENCPPEPLNLLQGGKPFQYKYFRNDFPSISANRDLHGNLWVSILDRLLVFGRDGAMVAESPRASEYWGQYEAGHLFFDSQNQVWVRAKEGVYAISLRKPGLRTLLQNDGTEFSVRGITELADKSLLACTYSGMFKVDPVSGQHEKLSDRAYYGALRAADNTIWLGSHSNEVDRVKSDDFNVEQVGISLLLAPKDEFLRPFEDPVTGNIYVGSRRQGLLVFDKERQEMVQYQRLNEFKELARLEILYLLPTKDCIWLATSKGLYQMDREKGIVARFDHFDQNHIYHLSIDENGVFWLATRGGGLVRWHRASNAVKHYTTADGLSHDIIYAVLDDGAGHLWLPSNYGLMSFEKSTGITINYLPIEGASNEEFNTTSFLKGSDGTFYFGGLNGITAFDPVKVSTEKYTPPLVITEHKVLRGNVLENRLAEFRKHSAITIQPDERFFTLEFALLDFHAKKQVYAWQLEGLDKDWTVQTENNVRLNALPYGNFTLRIKAQSAGSNWSENELAIPVTVVRPFYKTWNFALLCVLATALLTYFSVRWRVRWLRHEKQRLSAIVEERTRELIRKNVELESLNKTKNRLFGIIAHDLRSPLITLGGLARKVAFLIRQGRTEEVYQLGDTVENSVASVRNLLDNLLKWSILQDGRLLHNPEILDAGEVAEEVIGLYQGIAEAKDIQLVVNNIGAPTMYADRNSVSTVIRNLVDNAIKYTEEKGRVEVLIERRNTHTYFEVQDTGIGISAAELPHVFNLKKSESAQGTNGEKGNGLGLVLCRELMDINHGTIEAQNKPGGGSIFIVQLPATESQVI